MPISSSSCRNSFLILNVICTAIAIMKTSEAAMVALARIRCNDFTGCMERVRNAITVSNKTLKVLCVSLVISILMFWGNWGLGLGFNFRF